MGEIFIIGKEYLYILSPFIPEDLISWAEAEDHIRILGIEEDESTVGCALLRGEGYRAELIWYYLTDSYRGRGIGKECFFKLMQYLRGDGMGEIAAPVYADTDPTFLKFIEGYDPVFEPLDVCQASFPAEAVNMIPELLKPSKYSVPLRVCSEDELTVLQKKLRAEGIDIYDVTAEGYNTAISSVFKKEGEAEGVLLFKQRSSQEMTLVYLGSVSKDPMAVLDMLRLSASMICKLPSGTMVDMSIVEPKVKNFMHSVMKDVPTLKVVEGRNAVISLSFVDRLREEEESMAELAGELEIK